MATSLTLVLVSAFNPSPQRPRGPCAAPPAHTAAACARVAAHQRAASRMALVLAPAAGAPAACGFSHCALECLAAASVCCEELLAWAPLPDGAPPDAAPTLERALRDAVSALDGATLRVLVAGAHLADAVAAAAHAPLAPPALAAAPLDAMPWDLAALPLVASACARYGWPRPASNVDNDEPDFELSRLLGWRGPVGLDTSWLGAAEPAPAPRSPAADDLHRRRRHVAILGGSFSPPTTGHTDAAAQVLASDAGVDEVWLVPCGPRLDKPSLRVPALHRHLMALLAVEAAFPHDPRVKLAPLELWQPAALPSYTLLRTLEACAAGAGARFSLVIGADLLPALHTWVHAPLLLAETRFLLVPRAPSSSGGGGGGDGAALPAAGAGAPLLAPRLGGDAPSQPPLQAPRDDDPGGVAAAPGPRHLQRLARRDGCDMVTRCTSSSDVRRRIADTAAMHAAEACAPTAAAASAVAAAGPSAAAAAAGGPRASSGAARRALHDVLAGDVCAPVVDYIAAHGLYGWPRA